MQQGNMQQQQQQQQHGQQGPKQQSSSGQQHQAVLAHVMQSQSRPPLPNNPLPSANTTLPSSAPPGAGSLTSTNFQTPTAAAWQPDAGEGNLNPKPETRNPKPENRKPKTETRNPKPETRNLKPETLHPKPETRNPRGERRRVDMHAAQRAPPIAARGVVR